MAKKQKNNITAEVPSIATQSTSKKIGFFSAMLIVMGSSIGAGIFFKAKGVLESSQGSLVIAIFAWLIAAFAVISMALALVEIASARNDNLSLIGWCKCFNSRFIYKASKNFMVYIYLPLTYFFMPIYVIQSLQDAILGFGGKTSSFGLGTNGQFDWIIWLLISLAISVYFIFVSGMSSKAGNFMNMGITAVKFIPLAIAAILGFVIVGMHGFGGIDSTGAPSNPNVGAGPLPNVIAPTTGFGALTPGIGLFIAIGAIFFAFDGFYVTAGLQTEMKEPKKTPMAILFGLGLVTIIYLVIAISMSISGNGGLFAFQGFLEYHNVGWLFGLINLLVAIGVLGIINGFAMWAPRFVEDLISEKELPFSEKYIKKLNPNKPMIGIYYSLVITIPIVILFTIIGSLAYINNYGADYGSKEMGSLYTFSDLMGTWTAVFAFLFIMLSIFGGLKNRTNKFVVTEEKKWFKWSAWVSVIIISLSLLFLFLEPFVDVFMLISIWSGNATVGTVEGPNVFTTDVIVSRVMKLVMLFIFVGLMIIPTIVEDKIHVKKYGSIEKYEQKFGITPTTVKGIANAKAKEMAKLARMNA